MSGSEMKPEHGGEAHRLELAAFADGECDARDAERIREHLRHCPRCLDEVRRLTVLNQLLRAASDDTAPPTLWADIARRLDGKEPAPHTGLPSVGKGRDFPHRGRRPIVARFWAGATGLVALALVVAGLYGWTHVLPARDVVQATVEDFITYRARGWTVDFDARDSQSAAAWAQPRVSFAMPSLKERIGTHEIGGVRLCWLLERRLIGVTYLSGASRAVLYVLDGEGLVLPYPDTHLANRRPVAVRHHKGHGVAVWTENGLVFVLVAAELDFERVLSVASRRSCPLPSLATTSHCIPSGNASG